MNKPLHYPLVTLEQAARFFVKDNSHCPCVARLWEFRSEYNPFWQWSTFRRKVERGEMQRELRADLKLIRQKQAALKAHELAALSTRRSEGYIRASERRVAAFIMSLPENERVVVQWLISGRPLAQLADLLGVTRATLSKRRSRAAAAALKAFPRIAKRMLRKPAVFIPSQYKLLSTFVQGETIIKVYKA